MTPLNLSHSLVKSPADPSWSTIAGLWTEEHWWWGCFAGEDGTVVKYFQSLLSDANPIHSTDLKRGKLSIYSPTSPFRYISPVV